MIILRPTCCQSIYYLEDNFTNNGRAVGKCGFYYNILRVEWQNILSVVGSQPLFPVFLMFL